MSTTAGSKSSSTSSYQHVTSVQIS